MVNVSEAISLLLVGALWGCTNPFMRKGFLETKSQNEDKGHDNISCNSGSSNTDGIIKTFIHKKLALLVHIRVWLPYLIDQMGSLLYYKTLASSNLTLSVPICKATAMVFSSITSAILGERVNQPYRATFGVILVLSGVAICMYANEIEEQFGSSKNVKIAQYSEHFDDGQVLGELRVDSLEDVELEL